MTDKRWNHKAVELLLGRKIVAVRYLKDAEAEHWLFDQRPLLIRLDDGTTLMPMSDDEGNNGGALFTLTKEGSSCLPTLPIRGGTND